MGLVVFGEQLLRLRHVGPFRKALAPPLVVFRRRMELRQVIRDQAGRRRDCQMLEFHYRIWMYVDLSSYIDAERLQALANMPFVLRAQALSYSRFP